MEKRGCLPSARPFMELHGNAAIILLHTQPKGVVLEPSSASVSCTETTVSTFFSGLLAAAAAGVKSDNNVSPSIEGAVVAAKSDIDESSFTDFERWRRRLGRMKK